MIGKATGRVTGIKPGTWNQIADTVNRRHGESLEKGEGRTREITVKLHAACKRFELVGISADLIAPELDEGTLVSGCSFANRRAYAGRAIDPADEVIAILQEPGTSGALVGAMLAGVSPALVDITDTAHKYAKLIDPQPSSSAQLESAAAGPFRIVSQPSGTGAKWCTVQFPVGGWANLHADDADNAYTINRTDEDDDDKVWNPANDEPEDWADYDCVKLVLGFLRYDSSAGTLHHVTQEMHWHAANAPIIPAATVDEAEVGICESDEDEEGGEA